MKSITFHDKIIIIISLIISISSYGMLVINTRKSPNDTVVVRQDGELIVQLTQEELKQDGIYDFNFNGGSGQLEVKDDKVRMLPMNIAICPKAICSKTGWIDSNLKTIVCLPNRLSISFISDEILEIDSIAF